MHAPLSCRLYLHLSFGSSCMECSSSLLIYIGTSSSPYLTWYMNVCTITVCILRVSRLVTLYVHVCHTVPLRECCNFLFAAFSSFVFPVHGSRGREGRHMLRYFVYEVSCGFLYVHVSVPLLVLFMHLQLVWLTVFIATVLLGVDLSLVIGICFSFIILVMKTAL